MEWKGDRSCHNAAGEVFGMADVHDVAAYIVEKQGPVSAMKMQKLVYYSQAWHLVWDEVPLFNSRIEAWMNGPVVYELYDWHRGQFSITSWRGDPSGLTKSEQETIDAVLDFYGKLSPRELSELTHRERPWQEAREGLEPTDRSSREISLDTMQEFYSGVAQSMA